MELKECCRECDDDVGRSAYLVITCPPSTARHDRLHPHHRIPLQPNSNSRTPLAFSSSPLSKLYDKLSGAFLSYLYLVVYLLLPSIFSTDCDHGVTEEGPP